MFWRPAHLAWLAVWFLGTCVYTLFFIVMLIDDRVLDRYGALQAAGMMLAFYTVPVTGAYLAGLGLAWSVRKLGRKSLNIGRRTIQRLAT